MSGQIPKYGEHFTRESVRRDFDNDLAQTIYSSKRDSNWYLRANGNSEKWFIFFGPMQIAGPFPTMTEAGNRLAMALYELLADDSEMPPKMIHGRKNRNG